MEPLASAGRALCDDRLIDRDAVFRLKQQALRLLWARFGGAADFEQYRQQQATALAQFATYCVLAEHYGRDWRRWPEAYRAPDSPAVRLFAQQQAAEVRYHEWLQWLLDRQTAAAAAVLPLVRDLPVGVHPGGADAWVWQDLLAKDYTVGAPPDVFNRQGQDWGVPAFIPHKLRQSGYRPFAQTLRASLRHGRGLRIDHVMGLFRLFWIPGGAEPAAGAYVRYRAEELLAIVALESRRAGAFIVGEDLGNVEDGVRHVLAAERILSCRLLWFEQGLPSAYPELAMAAATTHDLPTIAGLWSGQGAEVPQPVQGAPDEAIEQLAPHFADLLGLAPETPVPKVIEETYRLLAQAPSLLLLATLDDTLAVREQPNMPGTRGQWPNWRLALPGGLPAWERSELPRRIACVLGGGSSGRRDEEGIGD